MDNLLRITRLDHVTVDQALFDLYADAFQAFDALDGNTVTVVPNPFGHPCDFDSDGECSVSDIDMLLNTGSVDRGVPVDASGNGVFDLNGSGVIDEDDVSQWLSLAATENGFAQSFKLGDASLDGTVNSEDLNTVRLAWQTAGNTWSSGDFNGDGTVDPQDLNQVGLAWQSSISSVEPSAATVPEPATNRACLLAVLMFTLLTRRCRVPRALNSQIERRNVEHDLWRETNASHCPCLWDQTTYDWFGDHLHLLG